MKKFRFLALIMVMSMFIVGFTAKAEEVDYYEIVKDGLVKDIDEMKEDERYEVISVEFQENVAEKVTYYEIEFETEDGQYREWIYLNGETNEVYAVLYDKNGDVVDSTIKNLSDIAQEDYMN